MLPVFSNLRRTLYKRGKYSRKGDHPLANFMNENSSPREHKNMTKGYLYKVFGH